MDAGTMSEAGAGVMAAAVLSVAWLGMGVWGVSVWVARLRREGGRVRLEGIGSTEVILACGYVGWFLFFALGEFMARQRMGAMEPGAIQPVMVLWNLVLTLGLLAVLMGVLKASGHRLIDFFGLGYYPLGRMLLEAVGLLFFIYPLIGLSVWGLTTVLQLEAEPQKILEYFILTDDLLAKGLVVLMAVVVAPVFEELVFRGFLYGVMKRYMGGLIAAVLTGLLFSLVHVHAPAALAFVVLSLGLTLAYERTGSIWVPIVMHMIFNGVTLATALAIPEMLTGE